ncbi:MAG: response regulator [Peptococcaceae bacterium]|nr:response regulator [Peptococcaceae bacterium]
MIRAIIVDDEQPSVEKMAKLLGDSGIVDVKGKFTNPAEALEFLKKTRVDAVFLDIEMPGIDGLEMSNRVIDLQGGVAVVFVTAYHEYAVEAFRLNALDYLLKPVSKDRLKETLDRIVVEKNIRVHPAPMQVNCFGKFKVVVGASEVRFRTVKAGELLAFLVDRRGSAVSRSEIIDALWGEYEGDRAVAHFNTTLYYLKKALLQHGAEAPVEHARGAYRLDPAGIDCDFHRFMSFIPASTGVNEFSIQEYEEIVALYGGEYLAGSDYQWAERNRIMLREKYIRMLIDIADYYKSAGKHDKTVEIMKAGLKHEQLHGGINFRLVEALLLLNDRISAARYYDMYRRKLRNEFGLEPDAAFKRLMR